MEATQWMLCAGYESSILFTFAEKYSKYQLLDFEISVLNIQLLYATGDIEWYLMRYMYILTCFVILIFILFQFQDLQQMQASITSLSSP